ncbi:MAG: CBS domain-containing protein [Planctomycetes bacterium]|nr:CBS domain-containing protein [Planctomycetota bacterium]MCC7398392.1 CBS domain-containing protein [Planctomycetota bacterium]
MTCDLQKIRAREIMNVKLQWATSHENLRAAAARMAEHGIRALLVKGEHAEDLPGIVTSKDIVNLLGSQDPAVLDQLHVGDVMTRPAICVPAQANVRDCINLMRMSGIRRVPVLDGTQVIGLLSTSDIFRAAMRQC